jgi:hypothetical protein
LTKQAADELETALINYFGVRPRGPLVNINKRFKIPSPEARAFVRQHQQRWRLPAIARIPGVSAIVALVARQRLEIAEARPSAQGGFDLWVDEQTIGRLDALRGPGESYSDVILRLAAGDA